MLKIIDLKDNPYPAQAQVNRKQIVNGEQTMSLSFSHSEMNMDFLPDLSYLWKAEFDKEQYTIINPSTEAIVKRKSITAILKFFTDFGSMYLQDEVEDKSMTALNAYTELFANTGKRVHLVDNFYGNTLNYSKNESRLKRFHYYNERFKAEFIVSGDDVYLYNKIGSYKPDVRIDEDLNVKSATVDIDSENFFTWCNCYYDVEDSEGGESENYQQYYEYKDDNLIALYGMIEGPALYQGNIRNKTTMHEYAEDIQRKTIKVSHSVDLIDLQRQGYAEFVFLIGDVIRLSLSSINTTVDIRIVEIDETWVENVLGEWERTGLTLVLGEASKVQSYKRNQSNALQELQDWIHERKPIPPGLLDVAIQRASDIINGDTDSVMEYRKDRLAGHHNRNAGNRVQMNVSGLEFVRNDVPTTAITYEGIIADAITAGTINTHNVTIMGVSEAGDVMTMDGSLFKVWNINDPSKYVEISKGEVHVYKGGFRLTGKDGRDIFVDGLMRGSHIANIQQWNDPAHVEFTGRDMQSSTQEWSSVYVIWDEFKGRYLNLRGTARLRDESPSASINMDIRVVEVGSDAVLFEERKFINKSGIAATYSFDYELDLQEFFNSIVDYRQFGFYVQVKSASTNRSNIFGFRVNRGLFYL